MTEKNHKIVLAEAVAEGNLFKSSMENILEYLQIENAPEWMCSSIEELIDQKNWTELNDRFHSQLVFGTGGMRGRTIGKFITSSERGKSQEHETPQYAAVGVNTLNEITVLRATKALYEYTEGWLREQGIAEKPRLVVAHDVRHFSERFCKLVSAAWIKMGGYSMIFDGPRSTPQLSFSVRHRYAHAGVVITASHNPSHDNGFKAYFGVSTNFGVMIDAEDSEDGKHQNEEWALVYTSVGPSNVDAIRESIQKEIEKLKIDRFAFYTLPITKALTYLGG